VRAFALGSIPGLVFSSSTGSPLSHSNFRRRVWLPALAAVGLEGVYFHDLRHTGNQLTADAGANPKELMARMGQDSERAALIYLHPLGRTSAVPWPTRSAEWRLPPSPRPSRLSQRARNGHVSKISP
jgi:integrase